MSFQGMIEDVAVADVMQLVRLGGHSGTLSVKSGGEEGFVGFERGRIVSAYYPGSQRLGELLLSRGEIGESDLHTALKIQNEERPRRAIGQILVRLCATTPEKIRDAMKDEIERVIGAILGWKTGRFEFIVDDLTPVVEVTRILGAPRVDLDTQAVLMDALRRMDEAQRHAASEALGEGNGGVMETEGSDPDIGPMEFFPLENTPQPEVARPIDVHDRSTPPMMLAVPDEAIGEMGLERPRLQLVSPDMDLLACLNSLLRGSGDSLVPVTLRDAGSSLLGEPPPIVVVDLRQKVHPVSTLTALCRSRPRASVIALFQGRAPLRDLYQAGVLSVTSSAPETIVAAMRTVIRQRKYMANERAIAEGIRANFAKLRRIIADLRSGLLGTSVSSNLLSALAESLARGVLFVPHRDRLVALGAFGQSMDGASLAETTRGVILSQANAGIFAKCISDMQTRRSLFDEAELPEEFRQVMGRPKNGEVVVLPVPGSEKLVALIYLDNGSQDRTIGDIEIFELASYQLGLALENELLRRELRAKRGAQKSQAEVKGV